MKKKFLRLCGYISFFVALACAQGKNIPLKVYKNMNLKNS